MSMKDRSVFTPERTLAVMQQAQLQGGVLVSPSGEQLQALEQGPYAIKEYEAAEQLANAGYLEKLINNFGHIFEDNPDLFANLVSKAVNTLTQGINRDRIQIGYNTESKIELGTRIGKYYSLLRKVRYATGDLSLQEVLGQENNHAGHEPLETTSKLVSDLVREFNTWGDIAKLTQRQAGVIEGEEGLPETHKLAMIMRKLIAAEAEALSSHKLKTMGVESDYSEEREIEPEEQTQTRLSKVDN